MKTFKKLLLIYALLAALLAMGAFTANDWFKGHAAREVARLGLPATSPNCVKHAFAAAQIYAGLRMVGIPPDHAQNTVLFLGQANEAVEYYLRTVEKRDALSEIAKDYFCNIAGITVARWLEERVPDTTMEERLRMIGELTRSGVIPHTRHDARLPREIPADARITKPDGSTITLTPFTFATAWARAQRASMTGEVLRGLR